MLTMMHLLIMSCSSEAFGSLELSIESSSSEVSLKGRGTLPGGVRTI